MKDNGDVLGGRAGVKERAKSLLRGSQASQHAPQRRVNPAQDYSRRDAPSAGNGASPSSTPRRELISTPLSQVTMRSIDWLMPGCFAFGKVVMLFGFAGEGKSTIALNIAARGSIGRPMPDGYADYGGPFKTLLISYEDDAADTIKPRLLAAGGNPDCVLVDPGVSCDGDEPLPLSFPRDLDVLEQALRRDPEIRLVVIDPWMAALETSIDAHRDQDTRRVTSHLKRIAEAYGVCVVIVNHLPKRPGSNAVTAASGSIGVMGQARVGILVDKHPENPEAGVLVVAKSNLGPKIGFGFKKVDAEVPDDNGAVCKTVRLEWLGSVTLSADNLLASREAAAKPTGDGLREPSAWLAQMLASGEWRERRAITDAGLENGFSLRTIQRAAKQIGVHKKREGKGENHRSFWRRDIPATGAKAPELSHAPPLAPLAKEAPALA